MASLVAELLGAALRGDRLDRSDQIVRRDLYRLLPGHGFGFKKEKSAGCHDGCLPKEEHERLLKRLRELGDEFLGYCRDSPYVCCTPAEAATTRKATEVLYTPHSIVSPDRSKAEQHKLLYGSPLSSHWGCKSGGRREPADRFQEDFYSHSGMGKGGDRPYGDGYDDLGSSSQPSEVKRWLGTVLSCDQEKGIGAVHVASVTLRGDFTVATARDLSLSTSGSRKGCSFPYASASSYAGPSADC